MFKLIFLAVFLLAVSRAANPGVKVGLNLRALNYGAKKTIDIMAKKMLSMRLPQINKKKMKLYNVRITRFSKPSARVSILRGSGLRLSVSRGALGMAASVKAKVWWFWLRANIAVSSSAISINLTTKIYQRSGKPRLDAGSCKASLGGLRVNTSGSIVGWLVNLVIGFFKGTVRRFAEKEFCKQLVRVINVDGNKQLSTLNLVAPINKYVKFNYHLTANPTFLSNRVETSHKGSIYYDPQSFFNPPRMSMLSDRMVSISISENSFNSVARVLHKKNLLTWDFRINNALTKKLFKNQTLNATIKITSAPTCSITRSRIQIKATVEAFLRGTGVNMKIKTQVTAEASVYFSYNRISGNLSKIDIKMISLQSSIPQAGGLNSLLNYLEVLVKPLINGKLQQGIPLPKVKDVILTNARIVQANRYIQIATNVY